MTTDLDSLEARAIAAMPGIAFIIEPDVILDLIRRVREAERERDHAHAQVESLHETCCIHIAAEDESDVDAIRRAGREHDALRVDRDSAHRMLEEAARRLGVDTDGLRPAHVFRAIEALKSERDETRERKEQAERALARLSPDGRPGVQLYLGPDSDAPDMPMFGIIVTRSPFLIDDDPNHFGARDVYQWVYDEESYRCEIESVGYLVDEGWLCGEQEQLGMATELATKAVAERDALRAERDEALREAAAQQLAATGYARRAGEALVERDEALARMTEHAASMEHYANEDAVAMRAERDALRAERDALAAKLANEQAAHELEKRAHERTWNHKAEIIDLVRDLIAVIDRDGGQAQAKDFLLKTSIERAAGVVADGMGRLIGSVTANLRSLNVEKRQAACIEVDF